MSGQAAIQISRGALLAMGAGAGSMYVFSNGNTPIGLLSPGLQQLLWNSNSPSGKSVTTDDSLKSEQEYSAISQQLSDLSSEVSRLRVSSYQNNMGGYYYGGRGGNGLNWTVIVTVGGVGALVMYYKGYGFSDIMYVTKAALSTAVETLEEGLDCLGSALEAAKRELSYKLGMMEENLEASYEALEGKITSEVGDVKRGLDDVGSDVKGISHAQKQVHSMVESIETQIDTIESKMENANQALSIANRGIYLLCNVLAENMSAAVGKGNASNMRKRASFASLYDELCDYTHNAVSRFGFSSSSSGASATVAPQVSLESLPNTNDGLGLLEFKGTICDETSLSQNIVEYALSKSASLNHDRDSS